MSNGLVKRAVDELQRQGRDVREADIPGLWWVTGYPELTVTQMVMVAFGHIQPLAEAVAWQEKAAPKDGSN